MTDADVPAPVTPPTEYRVTARARAGDPGVAEAGATTIDLDTVWGGTPTGRPGPADLLATAFAACLLKNLARSRDLLGFAYDDAQVEVTAHRQDSPPKFTEIHYTLRVTTDEPPRRVDLVHRNLRRYGTVYNTLAAVCDVHGEIVTGTTTGTPAERAS
ncbi:OsmC family protein [Myceligenerans xiligouense]|uniref:Putative OsmC-like protein n=1 Tax=Myceligenerans xiligouense TaxID=253184 RepID=A0A3N4YSL7_9MICO|nr:OsmC family protein [Myceligenerans xiligouense]RPF21560.1 putative OsmC-like protein [Myceligenerans xiligouense]